MSCSSLKVSKLYSCDVCHLTFNHDRKLYFHKKKEHTKKKGLSSTCDTTYRFFSGSSSLKKLPSARFTCDICKESYSSKTLLGKHEKIHVKHGFFFCPQCKKVVSSDKRELVAHMIIHTSYTKTQKTSFGHFGGRVQAGTTPSNVRKDESSKPDLYNMSLDFNDHLSNNESGRIVNISHESKALLKYSGSNFF